MLRAVGSAFNAASVAITGGTLAGVTITSSPISATTLAASLAASFGSTLSVTGAITPTGGVVGTATNNNATAGNIGEVFSGSLASGSAIAISSATPANIASITLTPGDWDCVGIVDYVPAGATTSDFKSGLSTVTAAFGAQDTFCNIPLIATALTDTFGQPTPLSRISITSSTPVFLIGQANFTVGTATAYGTLRARRMR